VFLSGQGKNPERPGYIHSIWFNPKLNGDGEPIMQIPVVGKNGETIYVDAVFDNEGRLQLPEGTKLIKITPQIEACVI
jgi:hypothetical protein